MSASTYTEHKEQFKSWDIVPEARPMPRDRRWLESRLARGERERFSEVVKVTPGLASLMLSECNLENRPLHRAQIQLHTARLQRGQFILTHHGISFSKIRILNDGQHRLQAIVESGIPGRIEITFGAEREEFLVIDQNRKRSAGDMLAILGERSWVLRASVAKMLYQINKSASISPDAQIVTDYAMELRGPLMDEAIDMGWAVTSKVCPPTPVAVAYYWIASRTSRSQETIAEFWRGLSTGENLNGVKLRLRNWLKDEDSKASGSTQRNCHRSAMMVLAWNAFVKGKKTIGARDISVAWPHAIKLPDVE